MTETIVVERKGTVVHITLDRPDAGNTVNLSMAHALMDAIRSLRQTDTRVIVFAARGRLFCGGGDVREMAEAADVSAYLAELAGTFHSALLALDELDAVIIAAVDGSAAGAGLGLVLHTDIVLATERARFLTGYERLGLTPDSGVSWLLPRTIGLHRALQLTMTSRVLDAATALDWGLVTELVPEDRLLSKVEELARQLSEQPTGHLAETRRLYRGATVPSERLGVEQDLISAAARRPHAREGIRRFAQRRGDGSEA